MDMIPCPHGSVWHWLVDMWMAVTIGAGFAIGYGKATWYWIRNLFPRRKFGRDDGTFRVPEGCTHIRIMGVGGASGGAGGSGKNN